MDKEPSYILSVALFVDGSVARLRPVSTRIDLGPFQRVLSRDEVQDILYAAKMEYGKIMRRKGGKQ